MFYDSNSDSPNSRLRFRKSESYLNNINNQKGVKNLQFTSSPSTTASNFLYIQNTRENYSKILKIPFKYELNNNQPKIASYSSKSSLHYRSKRSESVHDDKNNKQMQNNRSHSSLIHARPQHTTVSDNVIKSLDITAYSFQLKKYDSTELIRDSNTKPFFKSESQLTSKYKNFDQTQKNSPMAKFSPQSTDGYVINRNIRDTFHSKSDVQHIKPARIDENPSEALGGSRVEEELRRTRRYRDFLDRKFAARGGEGEDEGGGPAEMKLRYELAFEKSARGEAAMGRREKLAQTCPVAAAVLARKREGGARQRVEGKARAVPAEKAPGRKVEMMSTDEEEKSSQKVESKHALREVKSAGKLKFETSHIEVEPVPAQKVEVKSSQKEAEPAGKRNFEPSQEEESQKAEAKTSQKEQKSAGKLKFETSHIEVEPLPAQEAAMKSSQKDSESAEKEKIGNAINGEASSQEAAAKPAPKAPQLKFETSHIEVAPAEAEEAAGSPRRAGDAAPRAPRGGEGESGAPRDEDEKSEDAASARQVEESAGEECESARESDA